MRALLLAAALLVAASGCNSSDERTRLNVFAAASLTDAFGALERAFERAHPELDVAISFAGSQVLRLQIEHGARADLFASANPEHMQALVRAGLAHDPRPFAENELALIVPRRNPAKLRRLADLPRARRLVLGTAEVPVGRYARQLLSRATRRGGPNFQDFERRVAARVVSQENNVRLIRAKVELGEADAALVYRTDALGSRRVKALPIPRALNVRARYLLGTVARSASVRSGQDDGRRRFRRFVASPRGRALLVEHGFRAPRASATTSVER